MRAKGLLLLLTALCLCLSGCGAEEEDNTLWVVTELSNIDGMNFQAEMIEERMEAENPGLDVILDVLPTDPQERETRLTRLRAQIMSGNGPDVFLLPTGSELVSSTKRSQKRADDSIPVEPLFSDVQQAVRNGMFLDVSEYYDSDGELGKESLNQAVMEAGCFQGKRYVLPLRYNVPVIYANPELCREYGVAPEVFDWDFMTLVQELLSRKDAGPLSTGLKFPESIEALGFSADYTTGDIQLTQAQIGDYLRLGQLRNQVSAPALEELYYGVHLRRYENWVERGGPWDQGDSPPKELTLEAYEAQYTLDWPLYGEFFHEAFNLLSLYIAQGTHWSTDGFPVYTGYLSDILETLGVAKLAGQGVDVYPLRGLDGSVYASVAYWGAVGSSCHKPDLAYRFLRQFLLEEFQWDISRPRVPKTALEESMWWKAKPDPQSFRMVERSLPVRTDGCVEYLWDNLVYQVKLWYDKLLVASTVRARKIRRIEVTSEEVPYLKWEIDHVYFPVSVDDTASLKYALGLLNEENGTPTGQDIDALAEKVWQNLYWCIAEG